MMILKLKDLLHNLVKYEFEMLIQDDRGIGIAEIHSTSDKDGDTEWQAMMFQNRLRLDLPEEERLEFIYDSSKAYIGTGSEFYKVVSDIYNFWMSQEPDEMTFEDMPIYIIDNQDEAISIMKRRKFWNFMLILNRKYLELESAA